MVTPLFILTSIVADERLPPLLERITEGPHVPEGDCLISKIELIELPKEILVVLFDKLIPLNVKDLELELDPLQVENESVESTETETAK